jgi:hypothetical protein
MAASDLLRMTLLAGLVSASPLRAGDREFKRLVRDVRAQCHTTPMGTGFLGFLVRCCSPRGVSGLRMAIFDDPAASRRMLGIDVEGFVQKSIGTGMGRMVRVRNPRTGELTLIYAGSEGRRAELLMVTVDPQEVAVFSLKVDPKRLQAWMDDPGHLTQRVNGEARPHEAPDPRAGEAKPEEAPDPGRMR